MTLERFSEIFALLAVQLRFSDADEATIRAYYAALSDLEPEFVAMAAERFAREMLHDAWFPKAPEWRSMANLVEHQRREELRARLRRLPTPACRACADTGFELDTAINRVRRCGCVELRRLEILGRRPMPALPEAS